MLFSIEDLKKLHKGKRYEIEARLDDFRRVYAMPNEHVFSELAFCICTPQSKAKTCDAAIKQLVSLRVLFSGTPQEIASHLSGVRFHNNKARYIVSARNFFTNGSLKIKEKLKEFDKIIELREFLVKNVLGVGMKEASHFLRNIGMGGNIAILDRHILKNLQHYGVMRQTPKTINKHKYIEIENKMREFSKTIEIPLAHLDLLFWSKETGEIFK